MPGRKIRRDGVKTADGFVNVAWACRIPGLNPEVPEGLVMLYSLKARVDLPAPIKYLPDVTHELMVYDLDPSVSIDFTRSIWEQKELKPLPNAVVGFQFKATSEANAARRVQNFMDCVRKGESVPNVFSDWQPDFPEAIDIIAPMIEPNDPDMDLSVMADDDEMFVGETQRMPVRAAMATWASARAIRNGAFWTVGCVAATILVAGSIMPALDFAESIGLPTFAHATLTRTLEFPDGHKMVVKLTRKFGSDDHFVAELVNVEAPEAKTRFQDASY